MDIYRHKILLITFIIVFTIVLILLYRFATRDILEGTIVNIRTSKLGLPLSGAVNQELREQIEKSISDYTYIIFNIDIKNTSSKYSALNINIEPLIPDSLKSRVVFYEEGNDAPTNKFMRVNPMETGYFHRELIVERSNIDDESLLELMKAVKFRITFISCTGEKTMQKILSAGYNQCIVKFEEV